MYRNDDPPNDGAPEVLSFPIRVHTARVPHHCNTCGRPINPGERYSALFAVVDGEPSMQRWHGTVTGSCLTPEELGVLTREEQEQIDAEFQHRY